ncbi:MAG: hypothetical protein B7Z75_07770 [Acidocella sp. 20-57-95]|nr:MAG: hypothetical protein B7Z75_07770 [Acidocella sp. 20-57-95]OYV60502.1 MAG: hypothetical protein B7Z71_06150 [Acidocella sp. 21-58-7]HQT62890.1 FAD binding domain-containing protein [Acidocella sp.]HQU04754.1 FAD binding domain-containing protein [Acidocella sp.]
MKAVDFSWVAGATLEQASQKAKAGSKIIAGGQSLGPMLNLRIAQPDALVSIAGLALLRGATENDTDVTIGACVTHAQIADGLVPDIGSQILPRIAENIAYRAVRNRGTIGGSLCHADPAADWVTTLLALGASVVIAGADGTRLVALRDFFRGAFRTCLAPGEILQAVRIPKLNDGQKFGYYKACRKPGEFAHAMAAVLQMKKTTRVVIGAMGAIPLIFEGDEATLQSIAPAFTARAGGIDDVTRHMQLIAVKRAFEKLSA